MRTSPALLLSLVTAAWSVGCGDSGGSGPLVTVSPATLTVFTGDDAAGFQATLSNGATGTVTWTLDPAIGSISTTTGTTTSYTPPPLGSTGGTVQLRASVGTLGYTATITVNTATTGALTINVVRPTADPANLTVTGPGGFSQVVSVQTTTTLNKLAPGSYTITAAEIVDNTSQTVDSKYAAPPVPATVAANAGAIATVIYAPEPGYGQLWVAGGNSDLDGFTDDDLFVQRTPGVTPTTGATVQGIAFDASGSLWASLSNNTVASYAKDGLATSDPLTPAVTLTDSISDPGGVAIGADGRMWVANCGNNSVRAYPLAGGNAAVVIGSTSFHCPRGIAFDTAGNLWVANRDGNAVRFLNAQIAATNGAAVPDVTGLPAPSGGTQPFGIALDKDGNVWVAFCGGSKVARYNNGAFTSAAAVLSQDGLQLLNLDCPVGLALDKSGRLWVGNKGTAAGSGTLSVFSTTDMANSGTPSALTELTGIGITVGGLAFNPTAANLPIRH